MKNLTDRGLALVICKAIDDLERGGCSGVDAVQELRDIEGVRPSIHVGTPSERFTPRMVLEWYAGSILDVIHNQAWFAVNSLICACDKYTSQFLS